MTHRPDDPDAPLTLKEACELIFRNAISPATLRAEAARGRLVIERIGRRDFVTRKAIRDMRRLCEVHVPARPSQDENVEAAFAGAMHIVNQLEKLKPRNSG